MNKNIGDMNESELKDFIIELQEENSRYKRKIEHLIKYLENMINLSCLEIEKCKLEDELELIKYLSIKNTCKLVLDKVRGNNE